MSVFASVDRSRNPRAAISYLERTAHAAARMKQYAATAHAQANPRGFVLDVGCGAGHDLALLASAGLRPLGVDPSRAMLQESTGRVASPLVQGNGEALPFRSGSIDGCRIERVLIHVAEPLRLLDEVARCLRPGAMLTIFEPDWSGYRVRDDRELVSAAWLAPVRHPDAGSRLWEWVETSGFIVLDRIEELSGWRSLDTLRTTIDLDRAIADAMAAARIDARAAADWQTRQAERHERGEFFSLIPKVQIVAERA